MPDEPMNWPALLGMGAVIAGQIVAGGALGWLVDSLTGKHPIFLIVGLALGIVGAISYTVMQFRKYLKT